MNDSLDQMGTLKMQSPELAEGPTEHEKSECLYSSPSRPEVPPE